MDMYVEILVRYTREVYYISVWSSQIRTRVSKKKYHQSDENYIGVAIITFTTAVGCRRLGVINCAVCVCIQQTVGFFAVDKTRFSRSPGRDDCEKGDTRDGGDERVG